MRVGKFLEVSRFLIVPGISVIINFRIIRDVLFFLSHVSLDCILVGLCHGREYFIQNSCQSFSFLTYHILFFLNNIPNLRVVLQNGDLKNWGVSKIGAGTELCQLLQVEAKHCI